MITTRLKAETADHHKATEAVSYGDKIMGGTLTKAAYATLIEKNYILHALVENALVQSNLIPEELRLRERLKTAALAEDLVLLNHAVPNLPSITIQYTTAAQALGAMYVVEGATLGGAYILKALQRNPAIAPIGTFHYYGVYGESIGAKWKTFQESLIAHVNTTALEDEAIESAKKTFDLFTTIFNQQTA
jgi:heme oxygenase